MNKENLTAYEVVTEENLTDIHSTGWLLRHKKTGARVMLIAGGMIFNIDFHSADMIAVIMGFIVLYSGVVAVLTDN